MKNHYLCSLGIFAEQKFRFLTLLCFILISQSGFAQDRIFHKDGKEIKAKILGTDNEYIRYKRFDNLNGPDYFLYKADVLRLEYEKKEVPAAPAEKPKEVNVVPEKVKPEPAMTPELLALEKKAARYKKKSLINYVIGTGAIVAGAATLVAVKGSYDSYVKEIDNTNDTYVNWYRANYETAPDSKDLARKESLAAFGSPGVYIGAACIVGGLAFELLGFRNSRVAKQVREELASKKKQLSFQPFYQPGSRSGGIQLSLRF